MQDWVTRLDAFLQFNEYDLLQLDSHTGYYSIESIKRKIYTPSNLIKGIILCAESLKITEIKTFIDKKISEIDWLEIRGKYNTLQIFLLLLPLSTESENVFNMCITKRKLRGGEPRSFHLG